MTADGTDPFEINMIEENDSQQPGESAQFANDAGTTRRTQIKVAMQLLHSAGHLIVVQGESGLGKSDFLLRLQQQLSDAFHLGFITATGQLELSGLLMALGVSDTDVQLPAIDLLRTVVEEELWPVLLIDDADQLNSNTLQALLALWSAADDEGTPFSLVLAASPGFSEQFPTAANMQKRLHVIKLQPFSEKQTGDYLTQRLSSAGQLAITPLSPADIRALHARTQGIPARINVEIRNLLTPPPAANVQEPKTSSGRRAIILVAVALALLVGALIATMRYADMPEKQLSQSEFAPLPALKPPAIETERPVVDALQPDFSQSVTVLGAEPEPELEPVEPATPEPQQVEAPEKTEDLLAAEPEAAPAPTPIQQAPTAEPAAVDPQPQLTNAWLGSRSANAFTIQLVAAHNPAALEQFMEQHQLGSEANLLQVQREGRPWYVVVYGDYPNRADSRAALQKLPASVRKDGAWVRSFGELQQLAQ